MIALFIHDDAESDLENLFIADPEAAGVIVALLEELEGNPDLLDRLSQHDFGASETADFHVSKWYELWNKGINIWRLKIWDLVEKRLPYRIIYAYEPQKNHYHVMAIAPRDFDYDPNHAISQRILRAYEDL